MREYEHEEIDHRIFNKMLNIADNAISNGYTKAWFTWIEWITLTSVLIIAGKKTGSLITMLAGGASIILLFFVALVGADRIISKLLADTKNKPLWILLLVLALAFASPAIVLSIMQAILLTINKI